MRILLTFLLVFRAIHCGVVETQSQKPNVVIFMADDLGYDDISFHGSDLIPTPNIDALMTNGVALNRYYTAPVCTPSRSTLMTGKYPSNLGMQHLLIANDEPYGLGLDQKMLPEYMREGGYRTHLIGKWHLGFYKEEYTPTKRGFDTHFGYLGSYIDYYNQSLLDFLPGFSSGFDMRDQLRVAYETKGKMYTTHLLTDQAIKTIESHDQSEPMFMLLAHAAPHAANDYAFLQAPQETIDKFNHISDKQRRIYAAMVSELDTGIGKVVKSLETQKMLDNTIILFISDNGAPTIGLLNNTGSNYPLRGQKYSPWDGASRVCGAIWAASLQHKQRVSTQLFHISDWLPTFANIAGVKVEQPIDGKDIWESLSLDTQSPRNEVLCNLDHDIPYSSYIRDQWKYINGTTNDGLVDGYLWVNYTRTERYPGLQDYGKAVLQSDVGQALAPYSPSLTGNQVEILRKQAEVSCGLDPLLPAGPNVCDPLNGPCLFDILNDPCEHDNLALSNPDVLAMMEMHVQKFSNTALPPRNQPSDERSNPGNFNNTWVLWFDVLGLPDHYTEL